MSTDHGSSANMSAPLNLTWLYLPHFAPCDITLLLKFVGGGGEREGSWVAGSEGEAGGGIDFSSC